MHWTDGWDVIGLGWDGYYRLWAVGKYDALLFRYGLFHQLQALPERMTKVK